MVASSPKSQERFESSGLFMESPPVRLPPGCSWEAGALGRRLVIAASAATLVYLLSELLIGVGGAA